MQGCKDTLNEIKTIEGKWKYKEVQESKEKENEMRQEKELM